MADIAGAVGIRDSKAPETGVIKLDRAAFAAVVKDVRTGNLDL